MKKREQEDVEQCWFIVAHTNVGCGCGDDPLADIAVAWIQKKAGAAGLKLVACDFPVSLSRHFGKGHGRRDRVYG